MSDLKVISIRLIEYLSGSFLADQLYLFRHLNDFLKYSYLSD